MARADGGLASREVTPGGRRLLMVATCGVFAAAAQGCGGGADPATGRLVIEEEILPIAPEDSVSGIELRRASDGVPNDIGPPNYVGARGTATLLDRELPTGATTS